MSPIITPGSLGYRKLGDLPVGVGVNSGSALAKTLEREFGYEVFPGTSCLRLVARRRGGALPEALRFVRDLEPGAPPPREELWFIGEDSQVLRDDLGLPHYVSTDRTFLNDLVDQAVHTPERWLALARVGNAVQCCPTDHLPDLLHDHVLPALARLYPGGRLTLWRCGSEGPGAFGALRFLYGAALLPLDEVRGEGFRGFQSQQEVLPRNVFSTAPVLFSFLFSLFFPYVGGFELGRPAGRRQPAPEAR